jgi:hypothetical protein
MGTSKEWIQVILLGGFWGAWMTAWSAHKRPSENLKPILCIQDIFSWGLMGVWFGVVTTFHWQRAFHMPLVLVTVAAFGGACLVAIFGSKKRTAK